MIVKQIIDEDFVNYKKPSMFISFPSCTWKCEKECGEQVCQNSTLAQSPNVNIDIKTIINRYVNNPITSAVVFGGLEPFDSWDDLLQTIVYLRIHWFDDIVIYTGYYENEIQEYLKVLTQFKNIIVKFGRYIPNQESHYDEVLGVMLASDNQYGKVLNQL